MKKISAENLPFERRVVSRDEALALFRARGEKYKVEIVESSPVDEEVSYFSHGDFVDLCRGPHVERTGDIKAFKVLSFAGAYWRGDERNAQLQRVYGTAFATQKDLDEHLARIEEAKRRDHRVLGKQLDLYSMDELVGPGFVLSHPKVAFLRYTIEAVIPPEHVPRGSELGTVYRYARSGVLHGLLRVRGLTMDDGHLFVREEDIAHEISECLRFSLEMLKLFGFESFNLYLATRPESFLGEVAAWDKAESALRTVLEALGRPFEVDAGGGAFYGPKIDLKIKDALGREWQCSTFQLDYQIPQRFGLEYVAQDGSRKQPIMIHRALLGSMERFIAVLIEHHAGAFPLWLAPLQ